MVAAGESGAAEITDYRVEYATSPAGPYVDFEDGVTAATGAEVTGLDNGTAYWFRVTAVNSYGEGPPSAAMAEGVVPSDVPDAPSVDTVGPIDSGLRLEVTPGHSDSPIVSWEYRLGDGSWSPANEADGTVTIGGLTNGTTYQVRIRALNAVGASGASAPVVGTPRSVPGAPSALLAQPSDSVVSLQWDAPGSDNGAAVSDYVVQYATNSSGPFVTHPDGLGTARSAVVGGLTNGTTYHFRVAAVNAAGTGPSSALAAATPFTLPGSPVIASLEGADGSLVVDLAASDDGGAAIIRHEYRLDGGAWESTGSAVEPFTISGLANGTTRQVEVRSVNAAGAGPASEPASGTPRSTPAAPAISAVALDTGAVQVSFSLGSDGGSPVTNVEYSLDGGETWTPRSPASVSSPVSISGLVGGETYDVRVRAVNAVGAGAPSNESTVTAKGTPEAPSIDGVTPGDRSLRIAVSPGPNGGSPMTNYEVSTDGGDSWTPRVPASGASPIVVTGLTNGTTYSVRVRAVNAAGSGDASPAESATPRTTPGAPTIESDTVTGVGGELEVEFTAPGSDGGSPITGYQYSTDAGATWRDRDSGATGSPLSITTESADGATPLEGGRTYPVEIRAVNAAGPGAASAVADGITTTVPAAPVIEEVQVSHASAFVDFSTPANGGAGIIRYEYRLDDGPWTDTGSSASEFHLEGLSTSGVHTVEVRAVNDVGAGPGSASEDVWIRSAPAAPDVQDVTGGDGTLTVDFLPGDDGGDQISGYEYSTDGGVTWADAEGTASPILFGSDSEGEPLVNGTLYAVQIRARNGAGTGPASASTLVAPQGPPDAPVGIDLTPGDRRIAVDLEIPSDGGSSITGLQYRLDGGPWTDAGSLEAPFTITGLENGTAYTIEVRALNALGSGAPSEPATATASTIASAPRSVTASADDARTTVSWEAPVDDGGTEIERYDVAVFTAPGSGMPVALCSTADSTSCEIEGLENGTTYYVEVSAWNAVGPGSLNTPRVAVTPLGRPIVGIAAINPAAGELVVDVDTVDNGAPVITYEYRLDGGEWVSTSSSAEPFTIAGLETGTEYSVQVRALNSAGAGSPSEPVVATPRTLPGAPSSLVAESADGSVVLTWNAPASNGGAAITDYVVRYATSAAGPFTTADDGISEATTATVTGLTNGTGYVFRVAAVNAARPGRAHPLASATPLAAPGARPGFALGR
ncbi:MAG: fibronectin type III domain-containing protein [Microthrixaceae bacterium]